MPSRLAPAFALLVPLATTALAQATHIVGPGGLPDLTAALAVANPGDIIQVLPGTYPPFLMTKGVTIRGGPSVIVSAGPLVAAQIPAGQTGHLVGLHMNPVFSATGGSRLSLDECRAPSLAVLAGSLVVAQGCTFQSSSGLLSGPPAIMVQNAELTLVDCTAIGAGAGTLPSTVRPAIELTNARFRGSRLTVQGGPGSATLPGGAAIAGDAASTVWVSDSVLASGDPAICPITAPTGRHDRCTLTPNCSTVPSGFVLGVHRPQPLQNGAAFVVEFTASPGMLVGAFGAIEFQGQTYPELEQSLLLPATAAFALGNLLTDAQGRATFGCPVPAGPMFVDLLVWVQGFSGFAYPLQASPLVGGVVR